MARRLGTTIVTPAHPSKLRLPPSMTFEDARTWDLVAVVGVAEDGHVPVGAELRTRISPGILTVSIPAGRLDDVLADPATTSVEIPRPLGPVEG